MKTYRNTIPAYQTRSETHEGRKQVVVPVVMMVEGVHAGNHGPLLHTIAELGKMEDSWNGIPVMIDHPTNGDGMVSANSPGVLESAIGRVFNTRTEGLKLKAEVWLDEEKLNAHSEVAEYIKSGQPLDVSLGMFSEEKKEDGQWKGETYNGIAHSHRPDHLALLPGGTGACSWSDGCGIRLNMKGGKTMSENKFIKDFTFQLEGGESAVPMLEIVKTLAQKGFVTNEVGFRESSQAIQSKLDSMDDGSKTHYVEEVFDNYFIYNVRYRGLGGTSKMYKQNYSINTPDMKLTLNGDPVEVRKQVEFINVNLKKEDKKMERTIDSKAPCCLAKVEQLIANTATRFTEDDKEWLLTFKETDLDKLIPEEVEPKEQPKSDALEVNAEEIIKTFKASLQDPEEFKKLMPPEMLASYEFGLKAMNDHRVKLVANILANAEKDVWTEDQLKAMDTAILEQLSKSFKAPVDYSAPDFSINQNPNQQEALLPMGVEEETKE